MSQDATSQSGSFSGSEAKGSSPDAKGGQPGKGAKDEIIDGARHLGSEVKDMAADVAGGAKKAAETKLGAGKDFAAEHLGSVAHALRKTGDELAESDSGITEYVHRAASSVEKVSTYLQKKTLSELLGDMEGYARREPAVFLGGAFVVGLLGGRFLKSAAPAPSARATGQSDGRPSRAALPQYAGASAASNERYRSAQPRVPSDSPLTRSAEGVGGQQPQRGYGGMQGGTDSGSRASTFTMDPKKPATGTGGWQGSSADSAAASRESAARSPQDRSSVDVGGAGTSTKGSGVS